MGNRMVTWPMTSRDPESWRSWPTPCMLFHGQVARALSAAMTEPGVDGWRCNSALSCLVTTLYTLQYIAPVTRRRRNRHGSYLLAVSAQCSVCCFVSAVAKITTQWTTLIVELRDDWHLTFDWHAGWPPCVWLGGPGHGRGQAWRCSAWELSLLSYGYVTVKVFRFGRRHTAVCDLSQ